jgi:hypothetical protein
VCRYRNTIRPPQERFYFDGYEALEADMKRELGDAGWWLDTSALTAEQTADLVIRGTNVLLPEWAGGLD